MGTAKNTVVTLAKLFAMVVPLLGIGAWMSGGSFLESAVIVGGMTALLVVIFGGLAWHVWMTAAGLPAHCGGAGGGLLWG